MDDRHNQPAWCASLVDRLERFPAALGPLARVALPDDARWNPVGGAWSILEIVCHLADEEERDFRVRVFSTLDDPAKPWPGIDPEGWARDERYNERDLDAELARFERERAASVQRLRGLKDANWNATYTHPIIGDLRSGDILAAWVDHDALHTRQIAKRLHQLAVRDAGGYSTRYAGEWGGG